MENFARMSFSQFSSYVSAPSVSRPMFQDTRSYNAPRPSANRSHAVHRSNPAPRPQQAPRSQRPTPVITRSSPAPSTSRVTQARGGASVGTGGHGSRRAAQSDIAPTTPSRSSGASTRRSQGQRNAVSSRRRQSEDRALASPKQSDPGSPKRTPANPKRTPSPEEGGSGSIRGIEKFTAGNPAMIETIEKDILSESLNVSWEDIAKLDSAKRVLKEAVVLPLLMPELFTGLREPWKGVLLHGPPGTGKTMLAKAVATEAQCTFFNISAASVVSKYHGESEKMIRTLFEMARHHAPSVVFFDEIDALMNARGGANESDSTRRLKVELLQQMDGVPSSGGAAVMVLATTNKPWDLDDALRRRLEKRVYVPLPDADTREHALRLHLKGCSVAEDVELCDLAERSDGYSGADLRLVCREAAMAPMRRLVAGTDPAEIAKKKQEGTLDIVVRKEDFQEALERTQPSVGADTIGQYEEWQEEFGST